jgi:hypothetical protein
MSEEQAWASPAPNPLRPQRKSRRLCATKPAEPQNAGEADLCQHWRSANSAERAVELARAQIQWSQREFATLIAALLFTAAATIAAAMAVRAARQANRVAREVGRDQARAYVDLEWVLVELNGQRVRDVGAKLTNTGQTPAVWANVHADFRVVDASQNVEDPTIDKDAAGMDWGPVPAGGHSTVGIERDGMRLAIAKVFGAKGILTFEVFGRVRYGTIFDETYETEFSLHHNDLYNRTVMVEGDVPLLDQPCKLYRAPARRVAYKRLSGPHSD